MVLLITPEHEPTTNETVLALRQKLADHDVTWFDQALSNRAGYTGLLDPCEGETLEQYSLTIYGYCQFLVTIAENHLAGSTDLWTEEYGWGEDAAALIEQTELDLQE